MVGEIHLANIYFTDDSMVTVRPVLLVKPNSFNDFIYLPLTSNTTTKGIAIDNTHLKDGFLPRASVAVYEKVSVISQTLLIKRIGTLNEKTYKQIIEALITFLQL